MFKKTILSFSEGGTSEDWSPDPHLKFRSEILFFLEKDGMFFSTLFRNLRNWTRSSLR